MVDEVPSPEEVKQQCIFCQICSGQIPAKRVFEDDKVVAVLDINPASPGHMLVITKEHFSIMPQIPENIIEHLGSVSKALSRSCLNSLKAEGSSVFIANGGVAGQRAPHFMLHVIPRVEGDGIGLVFNEKKVSVSEFEKIHFLIQQSVNKTLGIKSVDTPKISDHKLKNLNSKSPINDKLKSKNSKIKTPSSKSPVEDSSLDDIADFLTGK